MTDHERLKYNVSMYDKAVEEGKSPRRYLAEIARITYKMAQKETQLKIKLPNTKQ